jgi:hypothetical protein
MAASQPVIDNIIDMEKIEPGILSKLLEHIREIDDRYARGVRDRVMVNDPQGNVDTMRNTVGAVIGTPLGHGLPEVVGDPRLIDQIARYAVPAASAGVRYGIPLAAASAVSDVTSDFYDYISEYGQA